MHTYIHTYIQYNTHTYMRDIHDIHDIRIVFHAALVVCTTLYTYSLCTLHNARQFCALCTLYRCGVRSFLECCVCVEYVEYVTCFACAVTAYIASFTTLKLCCLHCTAIYIVRCVACMCGIQCIQCRCCIRIV